MDLPAESLIDSVRNWAEVREDILALAVVGSHARGDARPDSDVDLVVVCSDATRYLSDTTWVSAFGELRELSFEDWGSVQSVRAFYRTGPEVEFGITGSEWIAIPPDRGTAEVVGNGCTILLDRDGQLGRRLRIVREAEQLLATQTAVAKIGPPAAMTGPERLAAGSLRSGRTRTGSSKPRARSL
jgi:predicted nucleotidyltransferase